MDASTLSAASLPKSASTTARPNETAEPMDLPVTMLPSITAPVFSTVAPVSLSSNPGKQVAFLPFKRPFSPSTEGAAQMAATILPELLYALMSLITSALDPRFFVPGIPPGRITQSPALF